jgi:hypothetical protein
MSHMNINFISNCNTHKTEKSWTPKLLIWMLDSKISVMPWHKDILQIQAWIYGALILPTTTTNLLCEACYRRLHHRQAAISSLLHETYCD